MFEFCIPVVRKRIPAGVHDLAVDDEH